MVSVPSTEFAKNFGRYRELAQREPVAVTSHERVTGYFLSSADYEEYLRHKAMMSQAYAIEDLPDATIKVLRSSKMDARHAHLDALLDD